MIASLRNNFDLTTMHKIAVTLSLVISIALTSFASRPIGECPNWTIHSAFDNTPRKIVDSPDYVYFFVHQLPYDTEAYEIPNGHLYATPTGALFIQDKRNPNAPMSDLQHLVRLSGTDMRACEIDPVSGIIVLAYNDGGVDLVTPGPSRKVYYFNQIKKRNFPDAYVIKGISFDNTSKSVRISCQSGYLEISTENYQPIRSTSWTKGVTDINSVGNKVIAIIDGKIHQSPRDGNLRSLYSFAEIPGATKGMAGSPVKIMPLSASHFGILSDGGSISLLSETNGNWTATVLKQDNALVKEKRHSVMNRVEQTATPTAGGWYIASSSKAYCLARKADNTKPDFITIDLPAGYSQFSSSYDLVNFSIYRDPRALVSISRNGNFWGTPSAGAIINAPLSPEALLFGYSQTNGLVAATEEGCISLNPKNSLHRPALVCTYRNGAWRNVSGKYHTPYIAESDAAFKKVYEANSHIYPVAGARGMVVDPMNPDFIAMGSAWTGGAICNISDPKNMPFLISHKGNPFYGNTRWQYPNGGWSNFSGLSSAGTDAEGNLWFVRANSFTSSGIDKKSFTMLYLTPDQRTELYAKNTTSATKLNEIQVPLLYNPNFNQNALVLKHPKNKGKILISSENMDAHRSIILYDHNNTLEDTSDDKTVFIDKLLFNQGIQHFVNLLFCLQFLENPVTGEIYVFANRNFFILDLDKPVVDNAMPAKYLELKSPMGDGVQVYSPMYSTRGCIDEYNRVWVGTTYAGVFGFDPQTRELTAHFTQENSPLPSNKICGLGWNPDTKSLFISTDVGLAEVKVDAPAANAASSQQAPFLVPGNVEAGYTGTVAVRNVPPHVNLIVTDADGNKMASLPHAVSGVTHWDLIDNNGNRAASGVYFISDPTMASGFPALMLTVK